MRCTEAEQPWGSGCFEVESSLVITGLVFVMIYAVFFFSTLMHALLNRGPSAPRGHWWPQNALVLVPVLLLGYPTYRSAIAEQWEIEYYRSIPPAESASVVDEPVSGD